MRLQVTEITHDELVKIFACVTNNGCRYLDLDYEKSDYNRIPKNKRSGHCFEDKLADLLLNGKEIIIYDVDSVETDGTDFHGEMCRHTTEDYTITRWYDGAEEDTHVCAYHITLETVLKGLSLPEAFPYLSELVGDDVDDATGYNLLECIMFGEIVHVY